MTSANRYEETTEKMLEARRVGDEAAEERLMLVLDELWDAMTNCERGEFAWPPRKRWGISVWERSSRRTRRWACYGRGRTRTRLPSTCAWPWRRLSRKRGKGKRRGQR